MTEPNVSEIGKDGVLTIHLCGKDWPIPKLAIRQNRVITPMLLKMLPEMLEAVDVEKKQILVTRLSNTLTQESFDNLATITYTALLRAHPKLLKDEFDNWDIGLLDMITNITVIAIQTGLMREKKPGETDAGEAKAASQLIGTDSSPVSAPAQDGNGIT